MTTAQDKFDREGNFSNPNEMYFRFIQQGVSTEMAASQRVAEQAKEIGDQLKGDLKFEGTSNLKDVSTAKSSDILSEEQEKGGRSR